MGFTEILQKPLEKVDISSNDLALLQSIVTTRSMRSATVQGRAISLSQFQVRSAQPAKMREDPKAVFKQYMGGTTWSGSEFGPFFTWNDGKRRCLLLHGILNTIDDLSGLAAFLDDQRYSGQKMYDEIWGIEYTWCADIRKNAKIVSDGLNLRKLSESVKKLDIYGHSMGGLVARWFVEQEGHAKNTSRLFLLGSPSYGVPCPTLFRSIVYGRLKCSDEGAKDLIRDEPSARFQSDLNDGVTPPEADRILYFTIAGTDTEYHPILDDFDVGDLASILFTGDDKDHDGIVPVRSAHYVKIGDKSRAWAQRHYMANVPSNHKSLRDAPETLAKLKEWISITQDEVTDWEDPNGITGGASLWIK